MRIVLIVAMAIIAAVTCYSEAESSIVFKNDSFKPGKIWLDDNGVAINAHGGGVMRHEGMFYWYGEHKVEGRRGNKAEVGVHVYSSRDLLNWKDEGIALRVSDDPKSPIAKGCILERPKVIRSPKTGRFVMYFHLERVGRAYSCAEVGIAVSESPIGSFTFKKAIRPNAKTWPIEIKENERTEAKLREWSKSVAPWGGSINLWGEHFNGGQMSRDMTLFVDDDGRAYHICASEDNSTLHINRLTEDFEDFDGTWTRAAILEWTEAPAIFKHAGWYWMIGSGCTGWQPNPARYYRAKSIMGPWTRMGNPVKGINPSNKIGPERTWGGQSTFVLPLDRGKGRFIAMFDIWKPDNAIDGRYVWLPVEFTDDGRIEIEWRDEWR